jgi:hypothetical protein
MPGDYRAAPNVLYTGMAKIVCNDKLGNEIGASVYHSQCVTEVRDYEERLSRL